MVAGPGALTRGVPMPDPSPARFGRPGRLTGAVTALVAAVVVVASGCSVIPAGNGPQPASVPGPPAGGGPCCGLIVRPPQVNWSAAQVVENFLLASAIVAHNYQAAREYLTKPAINTWHPGTAVTILAKEPTVSAPPGRGITAAGDKQSVLVTGQALARLSSTGQYIPAPGGGQAPTEEFTLRQDNGILKIDGLSSGGKPSRELLLTNDLFRLVYAPRNLWPPQHPGQAMGPSFYQRYVPHAPAGTKAYYLSQDSGLRTLAAGSVRGTAVLRASGTGQVALSKIAVSPKGNELAGLGGPA